MTKALLVWFCISNVVVALIVSSMGADSTFLFALKDIPYYVLFGYALFIRVSQYPVLIKSYLVPVMCGIVYLIISCILMPVNILPLVAALRQLIAFFIIYFATAGISRKKNLYEFISFAQKMALIAICFGWIEVFWGLWKFDIIHRYFEAKSIGIVDAGYPFHFMEPLNEYLASIVGNKFIVRATSVFLDPINYGHMLVFWIVTAWFYQIPRISWIRIAFISVCGITLLSTFSKGAWLQLALCLGIFNQRLPIKFRIVALMCIISAFIIGFRLLPGGVVHFLGLAAGLQSGGFMGNGLGMVGNYATMLGVSLNQDVGDSFWGSLIGQIGWLGLLFYLWALSVIYKRLPEGSILKALLISQALVAVLSENAFNISSIFGIAMACAIESYQRKKTKVLHHVGLVADTSNNNSEQTVLKGVA